jgi:signal transduction histidine kinase
MSYAEGVLAGWPAAATLSLAMAGGRLRADRRRTALNRALHELRRPLQVLALEAGSAGTRSSTLEMTWLALADLDREVNGGVRFFRPRLLACAELGHDAAARWRDAAALVGGTVRVSFPNPSLLVLGDSARLAQALDNLIANALEHGGPEVQLEASVRGTCVRISVSSGERAVARIGSAQLGARPTRRRGHGLHIVAGIAAMHGGRLLLSGPGTPSVAILELPLAGTADPAA